PSDYHTVVNRTPQVVRGRRQRRIHSEDEVDDERLPHAPFLGQHAVVSERANSPDRDSVPTHALRPPCARRRCPAGPGQPWPPTLRPLRLRIAERGPAMGRVKTVPL